MGNVNLVTLRARGQTYDLPEIADWLVDQLKPLRFAPPITHVYNPLEYARAPYQQYVKLYASSPREIILLGMNPGPWGMAQTGVPFGEVSLVRNWLGINASVGKPEAEHPKRAVEGFACPRSEVSGKRIWGWARDTFGTPERFFARFFVANYCPLLFLEASGRNRTPDKLPAAERGPLFEVCDEALRHTVEVLQPRIVIGVGKFAADRARTALADLDVSIGQMLHPSPANPAASENWPARATEQLAEYGIHTGRS